MRKKIFHNWGLKLGSIVIAFVIWLLVAQVGDPRKNQTYYNIPVELINTELLDEQNKVYAVLNGTDRVRVTVRAPGSVVEDINSSDIVAQADVSKLSEINTIAITCYVMNADVDIISCSPEVIQLNVEDKLGRWFDVQRSTTGEVAEGYMVASVQSDQNRIEVTGPKSAVEQIHHAGVEIDVSGATANLSANVEVLLYDSEGNLLDLPNVTKNVNYMHIEAEILAVKEVPIDLNVMGVPEEGYLATGWVESDPAVIMLAGTPSALANVNRISIPAEQLDIAGATEDMVKTINIREYLPDNVRLADSTFNGRITVTVHVEPVVERTLEIAPSAITLVNIPAGLEVQRPTVEEYYELTISGLEADVSAVQIETLSGTVDVTAWMEDQGLEMDELASDVYRIPVTFALPDNVTETESVIMWLTVTKL